MTLSSIPLSKATRLLRSGRLVRATLALQKSILKGVLGAMPRIARPARVGRKPRTATPLAGQGFEAATFTFQDQAWRYRLYKPPGRDQDALVPLEVMLHGCKQDAEDFARGTGMNDVAAREGFLVLYPEQRRKSNGMGCWNWFEPAHQSRARRRQWPSSFWRTSGGTDVSTATIRWAIRPGCCQGGYAT